MALKLGQIEPFPALAQREDAEDCQEEGFGIIDGYQPGIPEGEYEVRYQYYETAKQWEIGKVIVHFVLHSL